jgi:hypothetical protein
MAITVDYALKFLARNKRKSKFQHKTKYGRALLTQYGYDRQAHTEEYQRLKDKPFNPILWLK